MISLPRYGFILCALALVACAQGGRVAMGNRYAPVAVEKVQILFQPPPWQSEQIGIVTSLGAQVASDATVYEELQRQAAALGADAVLVTSSGMRQLPGGAFYNAYGSGSIYGNNRFINGAAKYQATGFAMQAGPASACRGSH
jgi:hypothetical protein